MKFTGRVWKFAQDDINTDQIRPSRYSHLSVEEQARHCMEGIDPQFASKAARGDIVVAGKNFGCGSSRPAHAALMALGMSAVVAESFARLFFRHSISSGLMVATCPGILLSVNTGDRLEVDTTKDQLRNLTTGKILSCAPLPSFLREMMELGGEKAYLKARLARIF